MAQLEGELGIDLDRLDLETLPKAAAKVLQTAAQYPGDRPTATDPTLDAAARRRRAALERAVAGAAGDRATPIDPTVLAAVLDQLWSPTTHDRLVGDWALDVGDAIDGISWAIETLARAWRDASGG